LAWANDGAATPHRLIVALLPGSWCGLVLAGYLGGQNLHQSCLHKTKKQNINQAWHLSVMLKSKNRTYGIWAKIELVASRWHRMQTCQRNQQSYYAVGGVCSSGCGIGT